MTIVDYNQVREYSEGIIAKLDSCENRDGIECAAIDSTMKNCAKYYCEFLGKLGEWGRDIFYGRVAYDAAAEAFWKAQLVHFVERAETLLNHGIEAEDDCNFLEGRNSLAWAVYRLQYVMNYWVTPKIAVGPSARQKPFSDAKLVEQIRNRVNGLPQLSADWTPDNPRQKVVLSRILGV